MNKVNWQERLDQLLSTGKSKSYFTAGVTVLFIILMSIVGIVPAVSSLGLQAEDNAKRDVLIIQLKNKLSDLENLTITETSDSEIVKYFDNIMPNSEHQEATITLLNDLALKNNLNITGFNFNKSNINLRDRVTIKFGENVKPLGVTINVQGQKDGLLAFANEVENSARILNIDDIVINRVEANASTSTTESRYSLGLNLVTYYFE